MIRIVGLKAVRLFAILLLISLGAFFLLELVPGDPAASVLGDGATPEQFAAAHAELGLDRPALERYLDWIGGALTGNFGQSLLPPVQDVSTIISSRLPVTLEIAVLAMLMAVGFAIPLAMWAAQRVGRVDDAIIGVGTSAAVSVPSFLAALLLIFGLIFHTAAVVFILGVLGVLGVVILAAQGLRVLRRERILATALPWLTGALVLLLITLLVIFAFPEFPRQGFVRLGSGEGLWPNLRSAFLPALTLAIVECAVFTRVLRNDLINTLGEDFILSARAKGMPMWWVMGRHALRPSSLSLVTVAGVSFGRLLGGTVIIEVIFRLPGLGSVLIDSIQSKDYPIVQAIIVLLAALYVVINALIDVSYTVLDPRLRRVSA